MKSPLLKIKNLKTHFSTTEGVVKAVDGVDLSLNVGRTLGVVGESGCGKTVLALSVMRLIPPPGQILSGEIVFSGSDLLKLEEEQMQAVRGRDIAMIFQEPMTALNPVFRVGDQIAETIRLHQGKTPTETRRQVIELLRQVGIPAPEKRLTDYPHQLSGGMRQRVMIAMALSCHPQLMIADEPTTALDVTIQAQILELIKRLQAEMQMAVLLISHDFGLIAEAASDVAVMYAGKVVECASVVEQFKNPLHPYTLGLMER
ncbi:MAG: ABC transporter ATP-binding protein, partial [Smithellaceae bacterium]|nr:ABC transporter ATP-binding protein [Smithellaceae bacterium]